MTIDTRKMMLSATATATASGSVSDELAAAIDALEDCQKASNICAMAMAMAMVEGGGMAAEVRQALDCADVCDSTARVLSRGAAPDPRVVAAVVEAAIAACDASGAACGAHAGHHEHCRLHSGSAKVCADALRALKGMLAG